MHRHRSFPLSRDECGGGLMGEITCPRDLAYHCSNQGKDPDLRQARHPGRSRHYTSHPIVAHNHHTLRYLKITHYVQSHIHKMAPKRKTAGPATKSQQSTLAFHGSSNKVTKSGVKAQGAKKNLLEKKLKDATPEILEISDSEPTTTEAAIIEQTEQEVQAQEVESTPEEDRARCISDAAIKKYWAAKEKQRRAPRAHQGGLTLDDKILREFDMSAHYGVSLTQPAACSAQLPHTGCTANTICAV